LRGFFFCCHFFFSFYHFCRGGNFFNPVRVGNAKFVSADGVASLEWISANAFFFALDAVLRVNTDVASVRPNRKLCVEESQSVTLPEG
jgi:hypothetical protein